MSRIRCACFSVLPDVLLRCARMEFDVVVLANRLAGRPQAMSAPPRLCHISRYLKTTTASIVSAPTALLPRQPAASVAGEGRPAHPLRFRPASPLCGAASGAAKGAGHQRSIDGRPQRRHPSLT
ncbi:hypothetical protein MTO96_007822 [Rhipicephalus appendiculatus]